MGNAQSALKMAAGLFLAIALITTAVILFISAQDATKTAQTSFADIQTELSQTAYTVYDGTTVSGSQAVNALRKFQDKGEFGIQVITGKNPAGSWYFKTVNTTVAIGSAGYGSISSSATTGTLAKAMDESNNDYINPSGKFKAQLIKDNSNVIRGITFTQN
ncbi:ABC transporter permease [Paenibacillus illinoisensis]|uniref:ABC transporter permease n=1 Tax=Paenibacillus illinoisensis TaxID=59845 RepID=UPI001C8F090F|nr:ABC transporter permease [Paenibacillus illinoisensis]MBY0217932.1 ABC transporter permease [Paenibacillus illinoisensis]